MIGATRTRALTFLSGLRHASRSALHLLAAVVGLILLLGMTDGQAQPLQTVPTLSARVIDRSATLDATQLQALEQKLARFETERGSQIVVLMVPTTAPEDIAAYANRVADSWKVGRRELGDGILLIVAKDDRRVRIEVARALEGAVPDLAAYQIIDRLITPAFRQNDFAAGINAGLDALMARIRGEELPLPAPTAPSNGLAIEDLGAFLFIAVPVAGAFLTGIFGRKLGAAATAGMAAGAGAVAPRWVRLHGVPSPFAPGRQANRATSIGIASRIVSRYVRPASGVAQACGCGCASGIRTRGR